MDVATKSPKRLPRKKSSHYSYYMLYDRKAATEKLEGISLATINPSIEDDGKLSEQDIEKHHQHRQQHHRCKHPVISDKMSCNYCTVDFLSRHEQIRHYKSDWHRYNLKLRLKGSKSVAEEEFEKIAGDVSSISGSEDDSEFSDTDTDTGSKFKSKPMPIPQHVRGSPAHSGTDSESEGGLSREGTARKYPKVYFKNKDGELLSIFRCLLYHKKKQPNSQADLISLTTSLPQKTKWAICMTAGGHFAAAIFDGETVIAHKTFHRYVVRARRGTAQSSRDSQGGAPKSAGASLRRYNEAALQQEVQDLLSSWAEHLKKCDLIFLRAPSFNRQMFYGNKNPPFRKDDMRIRTIPFPTRRPTLSEVKRVHQMLASIECYGEAADIQDFVPMSPLRHFSHETGKLEIVSEDSLRQSPRKNKEKEHSSSPLSASPKQTSGSPRNRQTGRLLLPDHLLEDDIHSSATSSASEADIVEMEETLSTLHLNMFDSTPVPKKNRRKNKRKRRPSLKHQIEPESDVFAEERYHLRNALYTACKVGDKNTLKDLLAVLSHPLSMLESPAANIGNSIEGEGQEEGRNKVQYPLTEGQSSVSESDERLCEDVVKASDIEKPELKSDHMKNDDTSTPQILISTDTGQNLRTKDSETVEGTCSGSGDHENKLNKDHSTSDGDIVKNGGQIISGNKSWMESQVASKNGGTQEEATADKNVNKPDGLPGLVVGQQTMQPSYELSPLVTVEILNESFGDNETTLLHVTAKAGHTTLVRLLLKAGCDPTVRDKFGKVPFSVSADKETRNEFRRFMGEFPDKYDYSKAQIPSPLTADMENEKRAKESERKKKQRKAKQEKAKEKSAEAAVLKAEEEEKKRFLNLSDREKRALAAERRLLQHQESTGGPKPVTSRCWQCAADISGRVPFEYSIYKFCTSKCLQIHRKSGKS